MCAWITWSRMTFTKTFMIATIECSPTNRLTWWTISIATLVHVEKEFPRMKSLSGHTLRLHGCFPQERKRGHLVSQRNS